MTQLITHFVKFADEATARTALPTYWCTTQTGWDWNRSIVDGPVPVRDNDGAGPLSAGYFLNIALPALNPSLPGLTGAGHTDPVTKAWVIDWGTAPITPQRVFA